jgi:class 3 adenylate cyclase
VKAIGNSKELAKSVGTKIILGLFFASTFMLLVISEFVNSQTDRYGLMITELTRNHLAVAASALSKLVSVEELDRYHTIEDTYTPAYEELRQRLIKFGKEYNVLYAFYWRDYGDGRLQYIVDNDEEQATKVGPWYFLEIKDVVERNALAGLYGATELGVYTPVWNGLITGYAPVIDDYGRVYCVAGVDISDDFLLAKQREARNMNILMLITIPLSITFAVLNLILYRRKAKQIEEAHIKLQYFNNNLRRAFSTYLSEDVVEEIVSDPTHLQLGGEKRYMTALFTDVKGFSGIAESLSPEKLVELLNYYLSTMSDVILEQKGTIDKYEGDAIVTFFGAPVAFPDHALKACTTAIMMKRLEGEMNNYISENNLSPVPLFTRLGINSGDMVVGNMGTQRKMNYTIVSNAVNLAARLEGINKKYGTGILASENTVKDIHDRLITRRLDRIRVVGINEPVRVYEVLETRTEASTDLHYKIKLFQKAHDNFESHNWEEALELFSNVLMDFPDDGPSLLYKERCRQFIDYPPIADWDGVFNFAEK